MGPVRITLESHPSPPQLATSSWDEVVDISQLTVTGRAALAELFGSMRTDLLTVDTQPGTWLRLRIHARGRDNARKQAAAVTNPVEEHLIQVWPNPQEPEIHHRLTDQMGSHLRAARKKDTTRR